MIASFWLSSVCWRGVNGRRFVVSCRFAAAALCLLLLLLFPGCKREGPEVVPVEGVITLGGGPWPKPGVLYFLPERPAPGMPCRPATGSFDTSGNVTVSTFKRGDGLIPGKYRIDLEFGDIPPEPGSRTQAKSPLPTRYRSAAPGGLTVTVEPNQRVARFKLDIARE
jgi:hypothetical protein